MIFPLFDTWNRTLAAGETDRLPIGRSIYIAQAASEIELTFYFQRRKLGTLKKIGQGFRWTLPERYDGEGLEVEVKTTNSQELTIYTGSAEMEIDSLQAYTVTASIVPGQDSESVADVTLNASVATVVHGGGADVRQIMVSNLSNDEYIRIGDALIGAARGARLDPGQTALIDGGAALYCYTDAVGVKVAVSAFKS